MDYGTNSTWHQPEEQWRDAELQVNERTKTARDEYDRIHRFSRTPTVSRNEDPAHARLCIDIYGHQPLTHDQKQLSLISYQSLHTRAHHLFKIPITGLYSTRRAVGHLTHTHGHISHAHRLLRNMNLHASSLPPRLFSQERLSGSLVL